ncbi:magnesium transporter MgtE N-terminal domain-containing protein [Lachnospiraceae bacterium C1.1]|nr:hypothetical protein [Lachnospiraceae bacterium C1.1]
MAKEDQELDEKEVEDKKKKPKKDKTKGEAEAAENDDDEDEGGTLSVILVTVFIVIVWLAILVLLIKLDVGGFGSGVLEPVLKDVPYVSKILPGHSLTASGNGVSENDTYAGYDNLDDAIKRIKELENQLADAQAAANDTDQTIADLQAEVARLKTYESNQVEFEKIKDEFYNEVVFGDSALDISEYQKYYEAIDPTNAEILYKQVVQQEQTDKEIEEYAEAYSAMKPKDAAEIFNTMTNRLQLVAKILGAMSTDDRGNILAQMDPETAAQVTKIMEPGSSGSSSTTTTTNTTADSKASEASSESSEENKENSKEDSSVSDNK